MAAQNQRNIKWLEGLRGITSILVLVTHVSRALYYNLFFPRDSPDASPHILQLPILRVPFQGRIGVPIFAFLTGFVCAYKPLKLAYQQGNAPASLRSLARSAFRRPPRLVLPAVIATLISFLLTCLGAYNVATRCDSLWVRFDAPDPQTNTFSGEVRRLFRSLLTTWTVNENLYDRHQWAMRALLIGAFQVYVTLAATIGMRFRYRIVVHLLMMTYWLANTSSMTETFGANLALGTLLAELSLHRPTQNWLAAHARLLTWIVAPALMIVGLYIGSYPHEHYEWAPWSRQLHGLFVDPANDGSRGTYLVPLGTDALRRLSGVAVRMCCVAIFLSPALREALSHRTLLWLGRHSFAVYLVHGTLLRTVGMWIVYGMSTDSYRPAYVDEKTGEHHDEQFLQPLSTAHKWVGIIVFVIITYAAAWAWVRYVDSACEGFTDWLERVVFDHDEEETSGGKTGVAEKGYFVLNGGHHHGSNGVNGTPTANGALHGMNGHGMVNGHYHHAVSPGMTRPPLLTSGSYKANGHISPGARPPPP